MIDASASPKGYCYPELVISHAVYLYHRLPISVGDVQESLFERGIDVSHETVRAWCIKFGPNMAEALRQRRPRRGRVWHLDEDCARWRHTLALARGQRAWRGAGCPAAKDTLQGSG